MKKTVVKNRIEGNHPYVQGDLVGDSNRYRTDKGEISLLHPCYATMQSFEIYCIEGHLFEDLERFDTLEEAEKRISELLN